MVRNRFVRWITWGAASLLFVSGMLGCDDDGDGGTPSEDVVADAPDAEPGDATGDEGGPEVDDAADAEADVIQEPFPTVTCDTEPEPCMQIDGGDVDALQEATNLLEDDTTLVLGAGTFALDNQVTIRQADGVRLLGQGIDVTVLSFADQAVQSNGVDVVGDDFLIQDLTIADAKKDGLRVEESVGVTIRRVKATWSGGPDEDNGAYGLYPVRCEQVLMEDSEAWHASDAGIYVGQSRHVVVRNNLARANVAGLEIENTQYADVYGNTVEENTAGLVVFDLPGNPIFGRDVQIHDNIIRNNNQPNFAPGGTVSQVPAGTGTFALASRRVEIRDNTYEDNGTVDIAILSGLAIESDVSKWTVAEGDVVGDIEGLVLVDAGDGLANYRTTEIVVTGNTHSGSGTSPDDGSFSGRPLGVLLSLLYGEEPVDEILYDAIGESSFDAESAAGNSNDNHVCVTDETGATFASLNLAVLEQEFMDNFGTDEQPTPEDLYRPAAPFAPFDCTGFTEGPIEDPTVPQAEER